MATFRIDGIDDLIHQLQLEEERAKRLAPRAVMAGGRVAADAMSASAPFRTGQLSGSIRVDGPRHTVEDGYYCEVYPDGRRRDGESNSRVGFVLEYGRSNMEARPWMRPALERAEKDIQQAMVDILTEEIT